MPAEIRDSFGNQQSVDSLINTGGEQTIRLLGPFTVNYNSPGVSDDNVGVTLFTPEEDWIILNAWVRLRTAWATSTTAFLFCDSSDNYDSLFPGGLNIKDGIEGETADFGNVPSSFATAGAAWTHVGAQMEMPQQDDGTVATARSVRLYPIHVIDPVPVIAYVSTSGDAPTAGVVDIYALIAEPA